MRDSTDPLFAVAIFGRKRLTNGRYGNPPKPSDMAHHRLVIVQASGEVDAKDTEERRFKADFPGYEIVSCLVEPAAKVTPQPITRPPRPQGHRNG